MDKLAESVQKVRTEYPGKHFVIADKNVLRHYENQIPNIFSDMPILALKPGESTKSFSQLAELCEKLAYLKADRHSTLWALGGGVTGDLAGFTAAVYMRGIRYYQIPTTLLSMVDSSVGGKTAVNLLAGKNMAGAFYQPSGVFMHIPFLHTLPSREIRCGLAEVVKSALLGDASFFAYLEKNAEAILENPYSYFAELSYRSVSIKKKIVQKDETEQNIRAYLNLGHTLAHAIETIGGYKSMTHGEAVAIGLHFAGWVSLQKKYLSKQEFIRLQNVLKKTGLPAQIPDLNPFRKTNDEKFIELMKSDKKNMANNIRFVMLNSIGKCRLPEPVTAQELLFFLKEFRKLGLDETAHAKRSQFKPSGRP